MSDELQPRFDADGRRPHLAAPATLTPDEHAKYVAALDRGDRAGADAILDVARAACSCHRHDTADERRRRRLCPHQPGDYGIGGSR